MRLPWIIWPFSWGLRGRARERARAEYYLDGPVLEYTLLDVEHRGNPVAYERAKLALDIKYYRISPEEHDYRIAELDHADNEDGLKWSKLQLDLKYKKISKDEYLKEFHTQRDRPFIRLTTEYDYKMGAEGLTVDWDWNKPFLDMLMQSGYDGFTDTDVVEAWWTDLCRSMIGLPLVAEEDETKDDDDEVETNSHVKRRRTRRVRENEKGPVSYS